MAFTHTVFQKVTAGSVVLQASNAYSEEARNGLSVPIAEDASDFEIDFVLDVAEIASIIIVADQDMLLEINDNAGGGGSISLKAGKPYIWNTDSYFDNLLDTNIIALFVTAESDPPATGTFDLAVIFHSTPA